MATDQTSIWAGRATCAPAPSVGVEVFGRLVPQVLDRLQASNARPGVMIAWYEEPDDDGAVVLHAGFDIGDHTVESEDRVRVVDLPAIEVAAVVHRGPMDDVEFAYETLVRWVEDSGYHLAGRSREPYHECHDDSPADNVTELQMPVAR